jgi:undecaprenyl-diphosphatase
MTLAASNSGGLMRRTISRLELAVRLILRPSRGWVRWPSWQSVALGAGGIAVVLLIVMATLDERAIIAARNLPPAVIALFREITDLGKGAVFLYPLPVLLLALCFVPADLPRPVQTTLAAIFARVAFVFLAIGVPYWVNAVLKQMIGRARPFVGGSANAWLYEPFSWGPAYASMPSNHAVTACAAAAALGAIFPRARTVLWIYAVIILISRVVVIAHHPSDVLAGAVFGVCGALIVRNYFASRRIVFGVTPQGGVEPPAGPSWRRIKAAGRALLADR